MVNRFELLGTVTHSPEFLRTAAGTPFCFLRMATERQVAGKERTDYHFITLWSAGVQRIAEAVGIGDMVHVDGRIEASVATRNDQMRASTIRLIAQRVVPLTPKPVPDPDNDGPVGAFVEAGESEERS